MILCVSLANPFVKGPFYVNNHYSPIISAGGIDSMDIQQELKRGLFASHADGLLTYTNIYARIKVSNKDTVVKIDYRSHKSGYVYIFPRIFRFFCFLL